jgi:hypothetical protein
MIWEMGNSLELSQACSSLTNEPLAKAAIAGGWFSAQSLISAELLMSYGFTAIFPTELVIG